MYKNDVINHFAGNMSAVARFLGISHQAVVKWPDIVPKARAFELQVRTAGALQVDARLYEDAA